MLKIIRPEHYPEIEIINDKTYKTKWSRIQFGKVWETLYVEGFYILELKESLNIIIRLMVRRESRGRGLGRMLLDDIILMGKPIEIVISEHDAPALAWLLGSGFRGEGLKRGWFGDTDGYVLRRDL